MAALFKKSYTVILYIGYLFFGGGFLIAFGQFVAYNGVGDIFEYTKPEDMQIQIEIDSVKEIKTIFYTYRVKEKEYNSQQSVYIDKIPKFDFYESNIFFNQQIPFLSYVGNNKLKLRSSTSGMIVMGFFFLFIFLLNKFGNVDKWIKIYTGEYNET
jgi:hypothetical protein